MTQPAPFTEERRARLAAAILGAPGKEFVTVRAADLRLCLEIAEAVEEARQLLGENEVLRRTVIAKTEIADQVPILNDQLLVARGEIAALKNRIDLARRTLRVEA